MKVKKPSLLKKIITALSNKTNELRIRIMIFFLLHKNLDKSSLTQSLHALVSQPPSHHRHVHRRDGGPGDVGPLVEDGDETNDCLLMHYVNEDSNAEELLMAHANFEEDEDEESVTETETETEEDIDHAADMFIQRFKRQMQLQKQHSLDRHAANVIVAV